MRTPSFPTSIARRMLPASERQTLRRFARHGAGQACHSVSDFDVDLDVPEVAVVIQRLLGLRLELGVALGDLSLLPTRHDLKLH
jgi:hypothetical protein